MIAKNRPYLIGETAFHHQGDKDFLLELIDHGKNIGLNALKFHLLLDLDDYMVANHDAIEILRPWCFTAEHWDEILPEVTKKGMDIILLCNDTESLKWVIQSELDVAAIELHATGLNDYFLLELASEFKNTVILGTGGSTIDEIQYAVDFLKSKGKNDIFLMHGFQNYPTDFKDINLSKMKLLENIFNLPVGYADHTDPNDKDNATISVLASAGGFNVLEKHFTHRPGEKRIDAQAAVDIDIMKHIRLLLNKTIQAYGTKDLSMSKAELKYGNTGPMKKAIVAKRLIKAGETLGLEHISFKRTNESSPIKQLEIIKLIGSKVIKEIPKDSIISYEHIDYFYNTSDISQFKNFRK